MTRMREVNHAKELARGAEENMLLTGGICAGQRRNPGVAQRVQVAPLCVAICKRTLLQQPASFLLVISQPLAVSHRNQPGCRQGVRVLSMQLLTLLRKPLVEQSRVGRPPLPG